MLDKPDFGLLSALFQIAGQLSAVTSHVLLAHATGCTQSWKQWEDFTYLVSQHSSTTALIGGILYCRSLKQDALANGLFYSGMVIGIPVWLSLSSSFVSRGGLFMLVVFLINWAKIDFGGKELWLISGGKSVDKLNQIFGLQLGRTDGALAVTACQLPILVSLLSVWIRPMNTLAFFCAFFFEVWVPIICAKTFWIWMFRAEPNPENVLLHHLSLPEGTNAQNILSKYFAGLCISVFVSMTVPACLLSNHGYFRRAIPDAFWNKHIIAYVKYTFTSSMHHLMNTDTVMRLWWSELLAFFA